MRGEALQGHLDQLMEEGVITQAEADEYMQWWLSRPDVAIGLGAQARFQERIQERVQDCTQDRVQARGMCRSGAK